MNVTLIGVQDMNFTSRDGNEINGVKVFFAYPDENTYGNCTSDKFIARNVYDSFNVPVDKLVSKIGEVINVELNLKKKIVAISI